MSYKPSGGEFAKELEYMATHPERYGKRQTWTVAKDLPRILVVDDDPDVTALLGTAMQGLNVETVLSYDGKDAVERINKENFDLILLDFNMPELNGEQVLHQISKNANRLISSDDLRLPIITYSAMGADLTIPNEEGFYILDHWQKPMKMAELKSQMIMVVGRLA